MNCADCTNIPPENVLAVTVFLHIYVGKQVDDISQFVLVQLGTCKILRSLYFCSNLSEIYFRKISPRTLKI